MKKYLCLLTGLFLFSSCVSRNAHIEKRDGQVVEAVITDGNAVSLYATKDGKELIEIKREEIENIDHPGNASIVAGSIMALLGASALIFGTNADGTPLGASYVFGGSLAFIGLVLAGEGLYVSLGSTSSEAGSGQVVIEPARSTASSKNSGLGYRMYF